MENNSIALLLLSILSYGDNKVAAHKLESLKNQLKLNEVEKKIIRDIEESIQVGDIVSRSFMESKYSYYFDEDLLLDHDLLPKDAIESAVTDIRLRQMKSAMAENLLDIGGKVSEMTPKEIKERLSVLHSNALVEAKQDMPNNGLRVRKDPYGDMVRDMEGLSLVSPRIEEYTGKAIPGTVVSILAFTGHFKSTFSINVAYQNAMAGKNILYLSLESTAQQLESKLVVHHIASTEQERSNLINSKWIRDKALTDKQKEVYNKAHEDLLEKIHNRLIIWDSTDIYYDTFTDMSTVLRMADKKFKEETGSGLDAVVVDQVSLLKYTSGSGRKASYDGAVINDWVSYFREQSLNFLDDDRQIVVFQVSQVNRNAFAEATKPKKKGRYDASCSSDSHEIERTSEIMITIFKDLETRNTALINVPKARGGYMPDNPIQMEVYGEYSHFGPIEADSMGGSELTMEEFNAEDLNLEDIMSKDKDKDKE